MRVIADRVGAFAGLLLQFKGVRDELPRDRIVGVLAIDQRGDLRGHRNGVARGNPLEIGKVSGLGQPALDQFGRLPQRRRDCRSEMRG